SPWRSRPISKQRHCATCSFPIRRAAATSPTCCRALRCAVTLEGDRATVRRTLHRQFSRTAVRNCDSRALTRGKQQATLPKREQKEKHHYETASKRCPSDPAGEPGGSPVGGGGRRCPDGQDVFHEGGQRGTEGSNHAHAPVCHDA